MAKKENEESAKKCFKSYLLNKLGLNTNWELGSEPPDYWMQLGNERFAVEVTSLFGKVNTGYGQKSTQYLLATLEGFANEIEKRVFENSYLHGHYYICLLGKSDNFREDSKILQDKILDYIRENNPLDETNPTTIYEKKDRQYRIMKLRDGTNKVSFRPVPGGWSGTPEVKKEACDIIQERITDKIDKLKSISLPKILLLPDSYGFAEPKTYKECVRQIKLIDFFHSIFIVQNNEGYFIYTQRKQWRNSPN